MQEAVAVHAVLRSDFRKVAISSLRATGLIPGVLYVKGSPSESLHISIPKKELDAMISDYRVRTKLLDLDFDGKVRTVMLQDIQFHSVTDDILHVDFMEVSVGDSVRVNAPIHIINKDQSVGVKRGGDVVMVSRTVPIIVKVSKDPVEAILDVAGSQIGQRFYVSDLQIPKTSTIVKNVLLAKVSGRRVANDPNAQAAANSEKAAGK